MKAYSMDLRLRVLRDLDDGRATAAVATKYSVSSAWVRRLKQRRAATGEVAPRQQRHGRVASWVRHADAIRDAVRQAPDATLDEYRQRFHLPMSRAALARALVVLGLTRKKSRCGPASRIAPMSNSAATSGKRSRRRSTPESSSSSTKPGPAPT
jgi:transposase